MPSTRANGKICYVEIPATDISKSSEFYTKVFGWKTRTRGKITMPATAIGPMTIACFRDPAGNMLGLYQQE
jgi:predicted enzyme related to lactoylglutathione lyase